MIKCGNCALIQYYSFQVNQLLPNAKVLTPILSQTFNLQIFHVLPPNWLACEKPWSELSTTPVENSDGLHLTHEPRM